MPRVSPAALIVNAYAVGNWGDTAIAEATIAAARRAGFRRVVVATADAATHASVWADLGADATVPSLVRLGDGPTRGTARRLALLARVVGRYLRARTGGSADPAMRAYRDADAVIAVGGGYLGGAKSGVNLVKLVNIRAALDAGRPTIVAGVSVNPSSSMVRRLLRWGLRGSTIFTRDRPSAELLDDLGAPAAVVPDMAVIAPSLLDARSRVVAGRPRVGRIGWAPRAYRADHSAWGRPEATQAVVHEALRQVLRSGEVELDLISHVYVTDVDDDSVAVAAILDGFDADERSRIRVVGPANSLPEAIERYRDLDVLVTSRMHAAIFAMAVGTPALAMDYEPKVSRVLGDLDLADRVLATDGSLRVEDVVARIEQLTDPTARSRTCAAFDEAGTRFAALDAALARVAAGVPEARP